jgi:hypothetical protein
VLAKLAVDSDKALAPFAAVREHVADYIVQSNTVAKASANQRGALARNLQLFPPFLERLGPAMERIAHFADETTPVFTDLGIAAPAINQAFTHLPAFSNSSSTFFKNLGKTSKLSGPALVAAQPLLGRLQALGAAAKPFSGSFSELLTSLRNTGGLERLLDFIFLGAGAANGYDSLGHFLRTEGVGDICLSYVIKQAAACNQHLFATGAPKTTATASSAGTSGMGVVMARTLAVLQGATPAQALAKYPGAVPTPGETVAGTSQAGGGAAAHPVGGSTAGTTYYKPSAEGSEAGGLLLNYLLGN